MDNVFACVYRGCVVNPSVNTRMIVRRKLRCVRFASATRHPPSIASASPRACKRSTSAARRCQLHVRAYMHVHVHVRHRHGEPRCFSSGLDAPRL